MAKHHRQTTISTSQSAISIVTNHLYGFTPDGVMFPNEVLTAFSTTRAVYRGL